MIKFEFAVLPQMSTTLVNASGINLSKIEQRNGNQSQMNEGGSCNTTGPRTCLTIDDEDSDVNVEN